MRRPDEERIIDPLSRWEVHRGDPVWRRACGEMAALLETGPAGVYLYGKPGVGKSSMMREIGPKVGVVSRTWREPKSSDSVYDTMAAVIIPNITNREVSGRSPKGRFRSAIASMGTYEKAVVVWNSFHPPKGDWWRADAVKWKIVEAFIDCARLLGERGVQLVVVCRDRDEWPWFSDNFCEFELTSKQVW